MCWWPINYACIIETFKIDSFRYLQWIKIFFALSPWVNRLSWMFTLFHFVSHTHIIMRVVVVWKNRLTSLSLKNKMLYMHNCINTNLPYILTRKKIILVILLPLWSSAWIDDGGDDYFYSITVILYIIFIYDMISGTEWTSTSFYSRVVKWVTFVEKKYIRRLRLRTQIHTRRFGGVWPEDFCLFFFYIWKKAAAAATWFSLAGQLYNCPISYSIKIVLSMSNHNVFPS